MTIYISPSGLSASGHAYCGPACLSLTSPSLPSHAGVLTENVASTLDGTALMLSAGAGSVAAGVPLTVMPAPLVAAGGLAMYLESGALRDYLLFVAGALGTGAVAMNKFKHLGIHNPFQLVSLSRQC